MAAMSEASEEQSSRQSSYIEPFDFEGPQSRDEDEMSQLRDSVADAPSDGSQSSRHSRTTFGTVGTASSLYGTPAEVPQPAHHELPDLTNWPLR